MKSSYADSSDNSKILEITEQYLEECISGVTTLSILELRRRLCDYTQHTPKFRPLISTHRRFQPMKIVQ